MLENILNHFDVKLASSPEDRDRVYRLRHRVYCEEHGYESIAADRRESDQHDGHSIFCTLNHGDSGRTAGCVRLILASDSDSLAMEEQCRDSMYVEDLRLLSSDRHDVCEISRLAVDPAFRKRPTGPTGPTGQKSDDAPREFGSLNLSEEVQRMFPMLGITTLLAGFAAAELLDRRRNYAMMEATLHRLLLRSGILVHQAGDYMNYHGRRAPFFITTEHLLEHMRGDLKQLYCQIRSELEAGVRPQEAYAAVA